MNKNKQVIVIGAGFAGLSAAALAAKAGYDVTLLEKNNDAGGRARVWEQDGFRFDMGPSWYWMPEVFENYFALFGKKASDFYELKRLDPSYRIYFGNDDMLDIPALMEELETLFEQLEPGSSAALKKFLLLAEHKYKTGMNDYAFKPSHSVTEYFDIDIIRKSFSLQLFTSMHKHVRSYFKNSKLIRLLEFPVLFLGSTPQHTPAMYSMMNYADLVLGTWYPMGGMHQVIKAMENIAIEQGVKILTGTEVTKIEVDNGIAKKVNTSRGDYYADIIISGADYEYTDQYMIDSPYRSYDKKYWDSRSLSPSALIFYIGLEKKIGNIRHHNLFFDEDLDQHAADIYTTPQWPQNPLYYVCCPSKTDDTVAPEHGENLFFLVPIATGLEDTEAIREEYFDRILSRFEAVTGETIRNSTVVKRSYAINDFKADYHSFKGNAYGLANTLKQTAFLKPKMRSRKIKNLLYTGQYVVPGPGVPPAIISGQLAANEAIAYLKKL